MKYTTFTAEGYHGGSIARASEKTLHCRITVDIHTTHTTDQAAQEHIYTDLLLSGAGKYTRETFIEAVNALGGSIKISIHNSALTMTLRAANTHASKLLTLFEIMIQSPTFSTTELSRSKRQTQNELIEHEENAKAIAQEEFENVLYNKSDRRYTNTPTQLKSAVEKVTASDLRKLHKKVLSGVWTVTIGSNVPMVQQVKKVVEACKKGTTYTVPNRTHTPKTPTAKTILKNIPSTQNIEFAIGTALPLTLHHPDYLPFVFGLNVLGKWGGFTGRLMSTVREKEGLTYGIYAKTETIGGKEQGHYRIMTFFAPNKAVQGLTSTLREINKIQRNGITQSEYERFQTILQTQQILLADSLTQSVDTLHGFLYEDFSLKEIEAYRNKLLTVTRKEINHALKKYLQPHTLVISGAGPIENVKKNIQAIQLS